MFDASKTVSIQGTIKNFEWVNPHCWIWINVVNAAGATEVWGLETGGTSMLRRMGIPRTTFNPGDKVTMTLHPLKSGEHGGEWIRATLANGSVIDSEKRRAVYSAGGTTPDSQDDAKLP
jgi:hypothetical protein